MTWEQTPVEARFAERIKAVRTTLGWSTRKLADRAGVSQATITKIERGERGVGLDAAVNIAAALDGVELDDLIKPGTLTVHTTIAVEVGDHH